MSGISPSIQHPVPIITDFVCAMADFQCSLDRQAVVAESISHSVWDLLDGGWFKAGADLSDIELLRAKIVRLGMRATVLAEALDDHARISLALCDAAPSAGDAA